MSAARVVMGVPTYAGKNYCWQEFQDSFHQILTDGFEVVKVLVDNTDDEGNREFLEKHAVGWDEIIYLDCKGKLVNEKLADSHNAIREAVFRHKADFMFHVESDVLCPIDTLQKLYLNKKRCVGGWYMLDVGSSRHPIHQPWHEDEIFSFQYSLSHCWRYHLKPGVQKTGLIGVGCVLIKKSLLKRIRFRHDPTIPVAPDTNFSKDCKDLGVQWWVNNDLLCYHMNDLGWGTSLHYVKNKNNE